MDPDLLADSPCPRMVPGVLLIAGSLLAACDPPVSEVAAVPDSEFALALDAVERELLHSDGDSAAIETWTGSTTVKASALAAELGVPYLNTEGFEGTSSAAAVREEALQTKNSVILNFSHVLDGGDQLSVVLYRSPRPHSRLQVHHRYTRLPSGEWAWTAREVKSEIDYQGEH